MDAVRTVESEVRELIRRSQLDPTRDLQEMRQLVHDAVADYDERSLHGGLPALADLGEATKSVLDAVAGFGPLQPYLDDPAIEEIWINEPSKVFVARGGTAELTNTILTADEVRDLVERMLKSSGRRVDLSSPFVDATLPDGSRLHVVIPDITREHWNVNIRKFVVKADHLEDLRCPVDDRGAAVVGDSFGDAQVVHRDTARPAADSSLGEVHPVWSQRSGAEGRPGDRW